mgnify:CR=1 FL=1
METRRLLRLPRASSPRLNVTTGSTAPPRANLPAKQFYAARISPAAPTHCIDGDLYGVPWRMAALCLQFDARGVCSDIELFEFFMMNCI